MTEQAIAVTGANQPYWHCLWQFLGNVESRGLLSQAHFIAFDLGLEPATLARLKNRYPWCKFRRFAFENYPNHVAMAAGSYAFKPLIINRLMQETGGIVLWFDSATIFRTGSISFLNAAIRRNGIYILRGQTALAQRCDPDVLNRLQIPFSIRRRPELAAGVLGLDAAAPATRAMVQEWAHHALIKDHIAPRIPRLSFHRPEQALLTWLVYREAEKGALHLTGEEIDISSASPVRWMTSRNFIPAAAPLWAGPFYRLYHAAYKTADRTMWRLHDFRKTRLDGLHRRLKEHFSVLLRDGAGRTWRLRPPSWCYLADPFVVRHGDQTGLLMECFDYRSNKGEVCAVALDCNLEAGPAIPILPQHGHASFPYAFHHNGQLYLVPETSNDRCVELHRCVEFPHSWIRVRTLLSDVDAADSIVFARDGYWWLITSVRDAGGSRHLEIYFTNDFLVGDWRPHPVNAERLYQELPFSSGRNGGGLISHQSLLLRAAQSSRRFYGEGLQLMQIEVLTPTAFRERPYDGPHPLRAVIAEFSPHHLSAEDGLAAFDIRDRARGGEGLWGYRIGDRGPVHGNIPIRFLRAKVTPLEGGRGSD